MNIFIFFILWIHVYFIVRKINNNGKTIKLYNGNIISSFIRLRIPAKIMAKTLFSRLKKQNYKESKIELLGILIEDNSVMAYIRFDRINNS